MAHYVRGKWQNPSGVYDFLGGHSIEGESPITTAIREASEEFHIYVGKDRINWDFQFKKVAEMEYNLNGEIRTGDRINREVSTIFAGRLPKHIFLEFAVYDENAQGTEVAAIPKQDLKFRELPALANSCKIRPEDFADGAKRVLQRYNSCPLFKKQLSNAFKAAR